MDQYGSIDKTKGPIDPHWSTIDLYWLVMIDIDRHWSALILLIGIDRPPNLHRSIGSIGVIDPIDPIDLPSPVDNTLAGPFYQIIAWGSRTFQTAPYDNNLNL